MDLYILRLFEYAYLYIKFAIKKKCNKFTV